MEVHIAAAALTFVKCGSPPPPPPPPPVESSTKPIPSSDSTIKRLPEGLQVCVVGAGSWGTTIAKIVGSNVMNSKTFDNEVKLWVFEEIVDGRKLSDIINEEHENKKYLPGYKLMPNVVAIPDLMKAVDNADILVFILPPEFIQKICSEIVGHLKPGAFGISLIKGIPESPGTLRLTSQIIQEMLGIEISVMMGANIANEVADEKFCEATIGCTNKTHGKIFKELFETLNFRITVVEDNEAVELCGALKNIVALGAGFTDGLGHGDNTKAAVIRLGLMEMIKFSKIFCKRPVHLRTFLESSGIADLITTCYGGRSRKVAEAFAQTGKSIEELEKEILKGQKLQGLPTVKELYKILKKKNMDEEFPLFVCIYQICCEGKSVNDFICCLQTHPGHEDLTKD
ncbi:glycerol-3-phosphate dehydrogenase [NAD(+)], cytoplasmic-like [Phascolarctos cinereus]|uniref:Glycerol-3-phosphate dehydrogenase [NAD(+)] n=1 Tax=Phascolarctos cinereus TaxID=38626 RepID=A0A6P5KA34_PHACI|nr:glycerol-3-phosphate dehydrogenase [NAD(+)], cytoplasmic-like isoform X1 [Phascolarctos cinereus]XP_020841672.1 glycerol-3-phosphate dehydrogenase [NAD(+)], cytoplasmic-like isoform X1 [Phascolarctos cinereus]XP_020841673.1 glycerol-3-phosphate dehydrogenase [NAD(+)], cytoplasmic-like isoform X1 [Phascolarctos cinereus]